MKNGLSYFQAGGTADAPVTVADPDATETTSTIAFPSAAQAKKAQLGPTETTELLNNMQQMINSRSGPMSSFNRGLERAAAWGSGGIQGPSAALNQLNQQELAEQKSTFEMRQQMAAYRAAQEQQKAMNARWGLGGTGGTPAAGGTDGTPAAGGTTQQQNSTLLSLVKDPALRQQIGAQLLVQGGEQKAMTQLNAHLAENAKDPEFAKTAQWMVNNGLIDRKMLPAAVLAKFVGGENLIPRDVRGPGGTMQTTGLGTAMGLSPRGQTPGAGPAATPGVGSAMPSAPAAVPTPVSSVTPLTPVSAPAVGAARPVISPAAIPTGGAPAPVTQQNALVPNTLQTGFAPGSKEDLDAKTEFAKQRIMQQGEQQKVIEKAAGESAIQLRSLASNAKNNIIEYDIAERLLKKHPEAFGIAKDGSATAAVIQLIKPGVQIPILGVLKAENAEEALAQKRLSPSAIKARELFNAIAARQGVEFAKNNLTGEGRGTLSNADMLMARAAKGLEVGSPAATNLIFTILNRENEMMTLQRNNAYQKYAEDAKKSGRIPDFNEFRSSPEFQKAMDDKVERIKKRFPEFFEVATKSGEYLGEDGPLPDQGVKIKKYNPKTGRVE